MKAIMHPPVDMFKTAKWAFSTRRVNRMDAVRMNDQFENAQAGDLILGRVSEIGQHRNIQLTSGRRSLLYPGDLVVLACGARYAPDQFEGVAKINPAGADMLAGGGCIGEMRLRNERIRPATKILPLGRIMAKDGTPLNLERYALPKARIPTALPVIVVFGTAMNSGKTLATARLAYGMRRAGLKVAALKGTGTGAFGDYNEYADTGVHYVADFTDAGMVTTYQEPLDRIKTGVETLLSSAERAGCDIAVMEIADGLYQRETAELLNDTWFRTRIGGLVFACGDAVAASGGVTELKRLGYRPDVLTGILSCSPMAAAEARAATGVRVVNKSDLADPSEAMMLARKAFVPCALAAE
ncbi:MAG: DUF1611 domain-containing protein [Pseudomonadota bacterium]